MSFSDDVVNAAWKRSGGNCECGRTTHDHHGTCGNSLTWANRGRNWGTEAWEAHPKTTDTAGGQDTLSNCEILCWGCYTKTVHASDVSSENPLPIQT